MTATNRTKEIVYPESDGKRMAENTLQFRWIVIIVIGLETLYRNNPQVFVAGDLLWYPVEGNNRVATAPDAMVIFGRPKGRRGAYLQWKEGDIAPQVVFEVLSPGNRAAEMRDKFNFYQQYGVKEYYIYDPDRETLAGWLRQNDQLVAVPADQIKNWTSPLLQVRFQLNQTLTLFQPDSEPFATYDEILEQPDRARQALLRAIHAEEQATEERRQTQISQELARLAQQQATEERRQAQILQLENERLKARLREAGLTDD